MHMMGCNGRRQIPKWEKQKEKGQHKVMLNKLQYRLGHFSCFLNLEEENLTMTDVIFTNLHVHILCCSHEWRSCQNIFLWFYEHFYNKTISVLCSTDVLDG